MQKTTTGYVKVLPAIALCVIALCAQCLLIQCSQPFSLSPQQELELQAALDSVSKKLEYINRYWTVERDTVFNGSSVDSWSGLDVEHMDEYTSGLVYFRNNAKNYHAFSDSYPGDSVSLRRMMDSAQYYDYRSSYLREHYLSDSAGLEELTQLEIASRMRDSLGYVDPEAVIDLLAQTRPAEGYPEIWEKFPNTPLVWDSLGIISELSKTFVGLSREILNILAEDFDGITEYASTEITRGNQPGTQVLRISISSTVGDVSYFIDTKEWVVLDKVVSTAGKRMVYRTIEYSYSPL